MTDLDPLRVAALAASRATFTAATLAAADPACVLPGAFDQALDDATTARHDLERAIAERHPELDERERRSLRRQLLGYSPIPPRQEVAA